MKDLKKMFVVMLALAFTSIGNAQEDRKEKCDFLDENKVAYNIKTDGTVEVTYAKLKKGKYAYDDEYVVLCKGDVVIPLTVTNEGVEYKVTSIGDNAFNGSSNISSITIGDNVTSIGSYAFSKSQELATVTMSDNLTEIKVAAFEACPALTSVYLSKGLTTMEGSVFSECEVLSEIVLPDALTSLKGKTFNACPALTKVVLGKNLIEIGNDEYYGAESDVFRDCSSLANIEFNDKLQTVGNGAFQGCSALTSVTFPASLQVISDYAFAGCESIETIDFSKCTVLEKIGSSAFAKTWSGGATKVESVVIPNSVKNLGHSVFKSSEMLKHVKLPENISSIGTSIFEDCVMLEEITIPGKIERLTERMFYGCSGLKKIIFKAGGELKGDLDVFKGCLPEDIYINRPVYCLSSCDKTNLKTIEFGENVTTWNNDYVGENIEKVIAYFDNPTQLIPEFSEKVFNNATLFVPKGLQYIYQDYTAKEWSKFAKVEEFGQVNKNKGLFYFVNDMENTARVVFGEKEEDAKANYFGDVVIPETVNIENVDYNVTSIGSYAFNKCEGLKTVSIPASVTSIGKQAFTECKNLNSAVLPSNLKLLGEQSFEYCEALTEVVIPNTINELGYGVFMGCSKLANVTLPENLTTIGSCAFNGCLALTQVTIPESVSSMGTFAFNNCTSLESINIPTNIDVINDCAFAKCNALTNIELKNNIKTIRPGAFERSGLQTVVIGSNVTTIGETAFSECQMLTNIVFEDSNKPLVIDDGLADNKWGQHSFNSCPFEKIYIGRELKGFDGWADNFLEELTLGADLTEWHDNYCGYTCEKVIAKMDLAMQLEPNFKKEVYETATLEVPQGMIDEYKEAAGWKNFKIIKEEGAKADAGISFAQTELTYDLSDTKFTEPVLNNKNNVTVTYSSNNENIATVDANTGKVTFTMNEIGDVVITATSSATDIFEEGTAQYTIHVTDKDNMLSIEAVINGDVAIKNIYSINGVKRNVLLKGLNIVELEDGRLVKVFIN